MPRLIVFNLVSLDGFIADAKGDMSWAHADPGDKEWKEYVEGNTRGGGVLLFGRVTYDMMASYWPTPTAIRNDPVVAERMNSGAKVVFSRTLDKASWKNTRIVKGSPAAEVRRLKEGSPEGLVILGSASIVSQLAEEGLVDEFQLVVNPVVLGRGKSMFETIKGRLPLKLSRTRAFRNGKVLLCYEPAA